MLLREVSRQATRDGVVTICARNRSLGGHDLHLVLYDERQAMWRVEQVTDLKHFQRRAQEIRAAYAAGDPPNLYPITSSSYELDTLRLQLA